MSARLPKCLVYQDALGKWRWTLVGGNGEIQCPSEGYATKSGAIRGFKAVQRNAARAVMVFSDRAPSRRG